MTMAHGVETRCPFLDGHVIRFATTLPGYFRVLGLKEKWLLKKLAMKILPSSIWARPKQPFRAPDDYVLRYGTQASGEPLLSILDPDRIRKSSIFSQDGIDRLRSHVLSGKRPMSVRDQMAICFAMSTQILHETFLAS
jgi:asparagine synthase (glutamine-hydrolysing)